MYKMYMNRLHWSKDLLFGGLILLSLDLECGSSKTKQHILNNCVE